jgi:peptide/nickel transport system permease protein
MQEYAYARDADDMRHKLGLDRPIPVQYVEWAGGVVRGDLGASLRSKTAVTDELLKRMPVTAELGVLGLLVGLLIAIPVGIVSALRQDRLIDYAARSTAIAFLAIPGFWLGTLVVTLPSVWWSWTPPLRYTTLLDDPARNLGQMVLPALILGIGVSGGVMRLTRAQMLEVLRQDYVLTAAAKGLGEWATVYRHALKNAFIPVLTLLGLQVSILVSGTVVLESIFVLPGMGRYLLEAVQYRDYPVIQGLNLLFAVLIVLTNLVVDVCYGWLDPRVRYR